MYGKLLPDTLQMDKALNELSLALELDPYSVLLAIVCVPGAGALDKLARGASG